MRAAMIIPLRNKVEWVERTLRGCFSQTGPCDIVIFGPHSTDGTDEVVDRVLAERRSDALPKVIRHFVPANPFAGTNIGVNLDLNWLHDNTDYDIYMHCNADDVPHPDRAKKTLEAFAKHNPSWLVARQEYRREDDPAYLMWSPMIEDQRSRPIGVVEALQGQIGSSGAIAWSRDLYDKYGPMRHIEGNDVILATMATLERGIYYVDETFQTMYLHDDLNNVGLEGQLRGARSPNEKLQMQENLHFAITSYWCGVVRRLNEFGLWDKLPEQAVTVIYNRLAECANQWSMAREELSVRKVPPLMFGAKAFGKMG